MLFFIMIQNEAITKRKPGGSHLSVDHVMKYKTGFCNLKINKEKLFDPIYKA